jgi:hypothetical protein
MEYRSNRKEQKDPILNLHVYLAMLFLILFLIEIHTGKVSILLEKIYPRNSQKQEPGQQQKLSVAEREPAETTARLEKLLKNHQYEIILEETQAQNDIISKAYRALAILESGNHPHLLVEAIQITKEVSKETDLPNNLATRIILAIGDPEQPGPTPEENLEAYRQIIEDLGIATDSDSIKKLRKLENEL